MSKYLNGFIIVCFGLFGVRTNLSQNSLWATAQLYKKKDESFDSSLELIFLRTLKS